jgi:hypothetical protein
MYATAPCAVKQIRLRLLCASHLLPQQCILQKHLAYEGAVGKFTRFIAALLPPAEYAQVVVPGCPMRCGLQLVPELGLIQTVLPLQYGAPC